VEKIIHNTGEVMTKNNISEKAQQPTQEAPISAIENERIQRWRDRVGQETSCLTFTAAKKENDDRIFINTEFSGALLNQKQQYELQHATFYAATGSTSPKYSGMLLAQTISATFKNKQDPEFIMKATTDALLAMNPADTYEGMLCTRLVALHGQYMHFMDRVANPEQSEKGIDLNINRAARLMRVYNETFDALCKYRRKGEQKFIVQHVNVQSGGQAIVGDVHAGGGSHTEK
jgi:hypothetical protein